jgi:DNA-binding NtrC family response regulator
VRRIPRILVVDDDGDIRAVNSYYLRAAGFEPVEAATCREALQRLGRDGIDLVITDWHMQGESGLALIKEMRLQGFSHLPVIVLSATMESVTAPQHGVAEILFKPIDIQVLTQSVRQALDVPMPA